MAIPGYRLDLWFGMRRLDRSKLKILSGEVRALTCVTLRAAEPQWVKPTPAITRRVVCATRETGQRGGDRRHDRGAKRPAKGSCGVMPFPAKPIRDRTPRRHSRSL